MPAPHPRSGGESLAKRIESTRSMTGRMIPNARDHYRANQVRVAKGWEGAASALEARANQARIEQERSRHLIGFSEAVRDGRAKSLPPAAFGQPIAQTRPTAAAMPRYWLGPCLRCDAPIWTLSAKPRVPICEWCRR